MGYLEGDLRIVNDNIILDGEVLLNSSDRIHNYSRVPLHRINKSSPKTIPELIRENFKHHDEYIDKETSDLASSYYIVIDSIISDYCMRRGEPLNVAEIGCDNGILSMHLAALFAEFAPDNDYVCVCSSLGNESGNAWLDLISQVRTPNGLSLVAADYSHTNLMDKHFQLTVINGNVPIDDPMETIKEAARITADDGCIFCISNDQYLLDDTFQLMFAKRKEWRFNPKLSFMKADKLYIWES